MGVWTTHPNQIGLIVWYGLDNIHVLDLNFKSLILSSSLSLMLRLNWTWLINQTDLKLLNFCCWAKFEYLLHDKTGLVYNITSGYYKFNHLSFKSHLITSDIKNITNFVHNHYKCINFYTQDEKGNLFIILLMWKHGW